MAGQVANLSFSAGSEVVTIPGPQFRRSIIDALVNAQPKVIYDDDVFIKTHLGRREVVATVGTLPQRLRMLLLLIDGRRSVGTFRAELTRYRSLEESIDMLHRMGMIERLPQRLDR
ncbi:MAG: hypothetical protein JSW68_06915 [Burkholderiales bacterium]|nr:MAG: hypothetical protein JSW68_06915 [Burkholderiales bacterium]